MIKYINGRLNDYSISSKIKQILLYLGYELIEDDLLRFIFFFFNNFTPKYFFLLQQFHDQNNVLFI